MKGLYLPEDVLTAMDYLDVDDMGTFIVFLQAALADEDIEEMNIDGSMKAFIKLAMLLIQEGDR